MPEIVELRPTTLLGLKRLAKKLKRAHGLSTHSQALDAAAQQSGYANYAHAKRQLEAGVNTPVTPAQPETCPLYISVHWRDNQGNRGRETLFTSLSAPWEQLITRQGLNAVPKLRSFRPDGANHLVKSALHQSPESARHHAFVAARVLQFIDATGLSPSRSHSRVYPGGSSSNAIPGRDHPSIWFHKASRAYIFVDEPYKFSMALLSDERQRWAEQHDQAVVMPAWPGIHAPVEGTRLCLISAKANSALLDDLASKLNQLPRDLAHEVWTGDSAQGLKLFVPPEPVAGTQPPSHKEAHPKAPEATRQRGKTVPYQSLSGTGRRPAQRMPMEGHREIAALLKAISREAYYRRGVTSPVDLVRNELDDWVQREYTHAELPNEEFTGLYYGDAPSDVAISRRPDAEVRQRWVSNLERAQAILTVHYPACTPVAKLLSRLARAMGSAEKWQP